MTLLEEVHGHQVWFFRVAAGSHEETCRLQRRSLLHGAALPPAQHEVGCRGRADEAGDSRGVTKGEEEHDPSSHRSADDDLRALRHGLQNPLSILCPAAEGTIGEGAKRLAYTRVVKAGELPTLPAAPVLQRSSLRAGHVRHEAGTEED
eukprot:CAMPEP_0183571874 /NCGR_PEP_ID=MMETSP0371-20130417/127158_1 /TAXON_ID=268820 /ORGANISM="Peridinium aciculiferum, Strain PAER-2" /LENGTH=148 /DNA_ID=CAMNT_0025781675 /DNA_START=138 /DNA_END=581 /DNA_ORIENTATION=+